MSRVGENERFRESHLDDYLGAMDPDRRLWRIENALTFVVRRFFHSTDQDVGRKIEEVFLGLREDYYP